MNLKIFNHQYFDDSVCYKVILHNKLDEYNRDYWYEQDFIKKHLLFELDSFVFEEILDSLLCEFKFYDCYLINTFYDENLIELSTLLKNEIDINLKLSSNEFYTKYSFIFNDIKESILDIKDIENHIKYDIGMILKQMHQNTKQAILKQKCLAILGI